MKQTRTLGGDACSRVLANPMEIDLDEAFAKMMAKIRERPAANGRGARDRDEATEDAAGRSRSAEADGDGRREVTKRRFTTKAQRTRRETFVLFVSLW